MNASPSIALSVVIPVYNEELNLPTLFTRLYPVLDALGRRYEIIFTNDGSADRSIELLRAQHAKRPDVTRVIDFNANYGQHMAIVAAFERVRGAVIVTLDADLQNPPEEIPKLLEKIDAGHDYVGGELRPRAHPGGAAHFHRAGGRRNVHAAGHHHFPAERGDGRHRVDRGIRRPLLPGRARPPALPRARGPRDEMRGRRDNPARAR